ncbi:uncharacterized protein LOC143810207 [Ranitomeya variabilis]|uniref:uncharacterized protein LOC143810207 n=1 Tax=Ranitomeya variabilis TaxID=490064 RepID=UPI0040576E16
MDNSQNYDNGPSTSSCAADYFPVPKLMGDDMYHVFISFSGVDSRWVHQLIHRLEVTFPSIKICSHDRDFTAGKTIIENMTESIQRSQKMLMVLSPDFVQSRWCLFEANLSMFQDCMSHKAIVPVMLKPCPMPLYLSHLTYLEAEDEQFFEKLCNRLLRNNAKEAEDILVHFQSSILYGGKHLLSLAAVNENDERALTGTFSDTCVPDSLKAVVKDPEIYKKAIQLINSTPTDFLSSNWMKAKICLILFFCVLPCVSLMAFIYVCMEQTWWHFGNLPLSFIPFGLAMYKLEFWEKHVFRKDTHNLRRRTGEANLLLVETSILAGCSSKSSLVFVFAPLKECKSMFQMTFRSDTELSKCMWENAIISYSCDYANCMANKHFLGGDPDPPGHLANGICFCQYVAMQIKQDKWS